MDLFSFPENTLPYVSAILEGSVGELRRRQPTGIVKAASAWPRKMISTPQHSQPQGRLPMEEPKYGGTLLPRAR